MAYVSKPTMTVEDQKILNYLMGEAGRGIWEMIPGILTRHPDRTRVLQFLKHRIEEDHASKANYYQALGVMKASEAESLLREEMDRLEAGVKEPPNESRIEIDYIACVEALFALSHDASLKKKLEPFLKYGDKAIQYQAGQALSRE
jgi:hypothetical protein